VASGKQSRQALRDSEKNKTFCVAVAQSNDVYIFYWSFALRHSHCLKYFWFLFFTLPSVPVTLVAASDV
jgi:hypothetical protein